MWANHTADTLWDTRTADDHFTVWDGAVSREIFNNNLCEETILTFNSKAKITEREGKGEKIISLFKRKI